MGSSGLSKLSGQIVRKNCPSVNKIFFQVTEVEKGHQGKVFEAEAEGQGLEMFPRCPFPNKFVRTIMTTDCFFAHLPTFRMNLAIMSKCAKKKNQLEKKNRQEKNLVK